MNPKSQRKKSTQMQEEQDPKSKFDEFYAAIYEMRKERNAPVDSMGAASQVDPNADRDTQNFQLLVALMLNVQTKDQTTDKVIKRLKEHGLTVNNIYNLDSDKLKELIFEVNFNVTKTKNVKELARMLKEDTKGKLPTDLNNLLKLPGVGKKTAYAYLNYALNKQEGIEVETHVHRISNRLGLVNTNTPEETREALQVFLKKDVWSEITKILVGFGQQTCLPTVPRCGDCNLSSVCPEGQKNGGSFSNKFSKRPKTVIDDDATREGKKIIGTASAIPLKKMSIGDSDAAREGENMSGTVRDTSSEKKPKVIIEDDAMRAATQVND